MFVFLKSRTYFYHLISSSKNFITMKNYIKKILYIYIYMGLL